MAAITGVYETALSFHQRQGMGTRISTSIHEGKPIFEEFKLHQNIFAINQLDIICPVKMNWKLQNFHLNTPVMSGTTGTAYTTNDGGMFKLCLLYMRKDYIAPNNTVGNATRIGAVNFLGNVRGDANFAGDSIDSARAINLATDAFTAADVIDRTRFIASTSVAVLNHCTYGSFDFINHNLIAYPNSPNTQLGNPIALAPELNTYGQGTFGQLLTYLSEYGNVGTQGGEDYRLSATQALLPENQLYLGFVTTTASTTTVALTGQNPNFTGTVTFIDCDSSPNLAEPNIMR